MQKDDKNLVEVATAQNKILMAKESVSGLKKGVSGLKMGNVDGVDS